MRTPRLPAALLLLLAVTACATGPSLEDQGV